MGARYGQHFLVDRRAIAAIIERFAPAPSDRVVELGAGRGALTRALAGRCASLAAIEIDADLARRLAADLGAPLIALDAIASEGAGTAARDPSDAAPAAGTWIVRGDALETHYEALAVLLGVPTDARARVIGNLPYGVATALVQRMVAARAVVGDALVMVQKEVADRMTAQPGSRSYGPLAVVLALTSERSQELTLRPASFRPAPKVLSSVVRLRFMPPAPGDAAAESRLRTVLHAAFAERRKMLAAPLARRLGIARARVESALEECGVARNARAEQLPPRAFLELSARIDLSARL